MKGDTFLQIKPMVPKHFHIKDSVIRLKFSSEMRSIAGGRTEILLQYIKVLTSHCSSAALKTILKSIYFVSTVKVFHLNIVRPL